MLELVLEHLDVFILSDDGIPHIVLRFVLLDYGCVFSLTKGNLQRQVIDFACCDGHFHFYNFIITFQKYTRMRKLLFFDFQVIINWFSPLHNEFDIL